MTGIRIMRTGIHSKADFLKYIGSKAAISSFVGKDEITYVGIIKDLSLDGNYLILDNAYNEKSIIGFIRDSFGKKQRVQLAIKNVYMIEIRDRNVTKTGRNVRGLIRAVSEKAKPIVKKCLTLIGSILLVLFILFYLPQSSPNSSNYVFDYYYSTPEILGANVLESEIIQNALNNTDKRIVSKITSVEVIDDLSKLRAMCDDSEAVGCAPEEYAGDKLSTAKIYVASRTNYAGTCGTFENTLYHEIGHVVDAYYNGDYGAPSESYAENYADTRSKDKCSTEEYKKLQFEIQEANRSINELNITCNEKSRILSRWNVYATSIPYELYNQYLQDYNSYDYCITEYNNKVDRYNDLIKEEDRLLERKSENGPYEIQAIMMAK